MFTTIHFGCSLSDMLTTFCMRTDAACTPASLACLASACSVKEGLVALLAHCNPQAQTRCMQACKLPQHAQGHNHLVVCLRAGPA